MQWHDLLGVVLIDFFEGSPYTVQTEVDLSLKKQLLDILVIRKGEGELDRALPDGLAPLANHNLISFKSHRDAFDSWALLELIAYYVNYRKQASPDADELLPESDFRLFGIAARSPEGLAKQIPLEETQPGVYDISIGSTRIRLLVIRNLADEPANAVLKLFSVVPKQIEFACRNYQPLHDHLTSIVEEMIRIYRKEDKTMAITLADLSRRVLDELSVKERLRGLTSEQRLEGIPAEERLKGLPAEERLKGLPAEEIEKYLRDMKDKKNSTYSPARDSQIRSAANTAGHDHLTGIVAEMIRIYRKEDKNMATTLADLNRKFLEEMSVDERLCRLASEQRLKYLRTWKDQAKP